MKIAVVSTPIFKLIASNGGLPGYGGLEVIAWQVASGLAAKGHEISLIAPDGSECPGVTIIPVGLERTVDEKAAHKKVWQHLLEVDAVIDHSWQKWSYILKMEGKLKCPVLGVMHAPANTMYQSLPPGVEKPCFVCISQDQADHFQALHGRPAKVAHNGVDVDGFYKPIGLPRTNRLLFLARFSSIKGADLALQACKEGNVELDLVGDTSITSEPEYFAKCQTMADGKDRRIVGGANRGECVHFFSQAKALLHPNAAFREPFGLAPVEAQAVGLPVIAWRYGAVQETIKHGETGWLVSSYEEFANHVRNVGHRDWIIQDSVREACRENAQRFTVQKMVDRYESLVIEARDGGW